MTQMALETGGGKKSKRGNKQLKSKLTGSPSTGRSRFNSEGLDDSPGSPVGGHIGIPFSPEPNQDDDMYFAGVHQRSPPRCGRPPPRSTNGTEEGHHARPSSVNGSRGNGSSTGRDSVSGGRASVSAGRASVVSTSGRGSVSAGRASVVSTSGRGSVSDKIPGPDTQRKTKPNSEKDLDNDPAQLHIKEEDEDEKLSSLYRDHTGSVIDGNASTLIESSEPGDFGLSARDRNLDILEGGHGQNGQNTYEHTTLRPRDLLNLDKKPGGSTRLYGPIEQLVFADSGSLTPQPPPFPPPHALKADVGFATRRTPLMIAACGVETDKNLRLFPKLDVNLVK